MGLEAFYCFADSNKNLEIISTKSELLRRVGF